MSTTDQRHAKLLDDLLEVILAEGFRSLTIAEMARRLHCSKTTVYALGSSKEQIIVNTVRHYFRQETEVIEERTDAAGSQADKVVAYLRSIAAGLRRASPGFLADLSSFQPGAEIYERNAASAARRVAELIDAGVSAGEFRRVHASFVAEVVAATIERIQSGSVTNATGVSDPEAFDALADLVLNGIRTGI